MGDNVNSSTHGASIRKGQMTGWDIISTVIICVVYIPFTAMLAVMTFDVYRRESRTYSRCRAHHPTNNRKGIK